MKARILFVCIENSCRSQIAEGLARMLALDVLEPSSAGSRPGTDVNPMAVEVMREVGYDMSGHRPKSVQTVRNQSYEYVITMGCGDECPFIPAAHHEDWAIADPKGKAIAAFRETRADIERRILDLAQRVKDDTL
jgi:arsenate reductase